MEGAEYGPKKVEGWESREESLKDRLRSVMLKWTFMKEYIKIIYLYKSGIDVKMLI